MDSRRRSRILLAAAALVVLVGATACGTEGQDANAAAGGEAVQDGLFLTPSALAGFVDVYVGDQSRADGWMKLADPQTGKDLKLKLEEVHEGELSETEPGRYFVCASLVSEEGVSYDLDFLLKKTSRGVDVSEVLIHKADGKPRYDWVRSDDGFWTRKPA